MQTKSTTVSVHRTLTERLPCISVRPFFLLLHVPPENNMIGSLKLSKFIIRTYHYSRHHNQKKKNKKIRDILHDSLSPPPHPKENIRKSSSDWISGINFFIMSEIPNICHFRKHIEKSYTCINPCGQ